MKGSRVGFVCGMLALSVSARAKEPPLRDGDVIFHTSRSSQSVAIQRATHSRYSHMGMILHRDGKPFVLEAAARVSYTPLAQWIARGEGHHYVVKRWRDADQRLDAAGTRVLRQHAAALQGKAYDLAFEWSDARMYCSELVWKIYERAFSVRLGETQHLREFDLSDAAVQKKLHERYGQQLPLEQVVISPQAMFDSDQLLTIVSR